MTGEMGRYDLEPGGDWYESGQMLRKAAIELSRRLRWRIKLKSLHPFDVYQGPYAKVGPFKLWFTDEDGKYYLEDTRSSFCVTGTIREIKAEIIRHENKT